MPVENGWLTVADRDMHKTMQKSSEKNCHFLNSSTSSKMTEF